MGRIHEDLVNEKPPKAYMWSGVAKADQKKEKHERAIEKPKLDDARRLRGTYFIDSEDGKHKETISRNARKKLEVPMEAAMLCEMGTRKRFKELLLLSAKRFKTLSCAHDSRCLASPSTPTPCYSLAAWLRNLFSQVTSSSLSSNLAASTPRSSTKNSFDADFDNLATTVAASEMHDTTDG